MLGHTDITHGRTINETYLASERELEEEVQNRIGYTWSQGKLQIDLVALQHLIQIFRAPTRDDPNEMVLDHGYHGVGDASLFGCETGVQILAEFLAQFPQDDGAISDLFTV